MWKTSEVWMDPEWCYKRQLLTFTENEWYALRTLSDTGFVPEAERIDKNLIRTRRLYSSSVFDPLKLERECERFLQVLKEHGLRHGDLTTPHIFVYNNGPVVIDWSESRLLDDPRPDKRPEGDLHWMTKTMHSILMMRTW